MQTKIIAGLILTLTIIVFIAVYWATEPGRQQAASERIHDEAVERGREIYSSFCKVCHGEDGTSIPEVVLRNTVLDKDVLIKNINRGITGTAMPAFGEEDGGPLTEHQVQAVIAFLKDWSEDISFTGETAAHTEEIVDGLESAIGDGGTTYMADAEAIYSASCAVCHGADRGGIEGLAPALTRDSLSALSSSELADVISSGRAGTMMPPFGDRFTQSEIDALMELLLE